MENIEGFTEEQRFGYLLALREIERLIGRKIATLTYQHKLRTGEASPETHNVPKDDEPAYVRLHRERQS